jgi:hypothetical protein
MSDPSAGARAPDVTPRADVPTTPVYSDTTPVYTDTTYPAAEAYPVSESYNYGGTDSDTGEQSAVKQAAGQSAQAAGQAASEVKDTAKEQAQRVGSEAKAQARNVAADVKDKVRTQAKTQNDKLVGTIRDVAGQLDEMRGDRADSPAATVVSRVADGGRQMADYLDRNGPEGVLREVSDFARRRPGAFLVTALAAGFVVGRLGKGVMKADEAPSSGTSVKPSTDSFVSTPSYVDPTPAYDPALDNVGYQATTTSTGTTTEYASTGTGTPLVVEEEYDYRTGGTR